LESKKKQEQVKKKVWGKTDTSHTPGNEVNNRKKKYQTKKGIITLQTKVAQ